ncbi:hypothetical protein, partial [Anoxybacillus sp. LAT27]|uniref:hypothetical protein n=1 Tax=Anoxybacillus sp. LAT27 TaxID=2878409 RepID=UPI001EDB18A3
CIQKGSTGNTMEPGKRLHVHPANAPCKARVHRSYYEQGRLVPHLDRLPGIPPGFFSCGATVRSTHTVS